MWSSDAPCTRGWTLTLVFRLRLDPGLSKKRVQCQTCVMVWLRSVGMTGRSVGGRATRPSKQSCCSHWAREFSLRPSQFRLSELTATYNFRAQYSAMGSVDKLSDCCLHTQVGMERCHASSALVVFTAVAGAATGGAGLLDQVGLISLLIVL